MGGEQAVGQPIGRRGDHGEDQQSAGGKARLPPGGDRPPLSPERPGPQGVRQRVGGHGGQGWEELAEVKRRGRVEKLHGPNVVVDAPP
jgi:hypothetical protein